jgi:DNA repair photolyase
MAKFTERALSTTADHAHPDARRGRGAVSAVRSRYDTETRQREDDGWDNLETADPLRTTLHLDNSRSIIAWNKSPDIPFDRSINPYRGCEHGCIYCFARPSHAYLGYSPGLDFETQIVIKPNAAMLLRGELAKSGYRVATMSMGTNTDPYQPIERDYRLTRQILEIMDRTNHPVGIVTKSANVLKDIDVLASLGRKGLVRVSLSVTTLDHRLARKMEPRASTPMRRVEAIAKLTEAGVPTSAMMAPIIPAINDSEIETVLETVAKAGAVSAHWVLLRLPLEISPLFQEWLAEEFPDRAKKVMSLLRSMRGGKDYVSNWGERQTGEGVYAQLIAKRFSLAVKRLGLNQEKPSLRKDLFTPPAAQNAQARQGQLDLFG